MPYRDTMPIIPNTTMQIGYNNEGVDLTYKITPNKDYILHDKTRDTEDIDQDTLEPKLDENGMSIIIQGFTSGTVSCDIGYDFETNSREFFTKLKEQEESNEVEKCSR